MGVQEILVENPFDLLYHRLLRVEIHPTVGKSFQWDLQVASVNCQGVAMMGGEMNFQSGLGAFPAAQWSIVKVFQLTRDILRHLVAGKKASCKATVRSRPDGGKTCDYFITLELLPDE